MKGSTCGQTGRKEAAERKREVLGTPQTPAKGFALCTPVLLSGCRWKCGNALQIANVDGIVYFTIIGRLPAASRSSRSFQFRE